MRVTTAVAILVAVVVPQVAGHSGARQQAATHPGFDRAALDGTGDPCADFYQYACGGWVAANPIPPDRAIWGRFYEVRETTTQTLRNVLDRASRHVPERTPLDQKIGDYYASCLAEPEVERLGGSPLRPHLDRIAAISTAEDLAHEVANLHAAGVRAFFTFGSAQDFKNAASVVAVLDQSGLGLPDRDSYLKDDPGSGTLRGRYVDHIAAMFTMAGDTADRAASNAAEVLEIEAALAGVSMDVVARRDPSKVSNKLTTAALAALAPAFEWERYFAATSSPRFSELTVRTPDFFRGLGALMASSPVDRWKPYLRWQLIRATALLLSPAFVDESFRFYGRTLTGATENSPRWKRCVQVVDGDLGEALGQRYVEATFDAASKARMQRLVKGIEDAMARDIVNLPWMSDPTRQRALQKLRAVRTKIGYPDRWRDYGSLTIARDDLVGNAQRSKRVEFTRQLAKIGRPFDRDEWWITPQTVDAYASGSRNEVVFPAGILQPPFFSADMDDAAILGAIGGLIGHELTHLFDDSGRKFDADGNLNDWWSAQDAAEFERRGSCLAEQYSGYTAIGDVKVNGRLTLGENVADNGGLRVAHMALQQTLANRRPSTPAATDRQFFLAYAQGWCQAVRPDAERLRAATDPHSPGRHRVNGVVSNMPEFREAFACAAGAPMAPARTCRVW